MMKACFLVHRKLESELGISSDFDFRADQYGPLDPKVYDTLEYLEGEDLISAEESEEYDGTEFRVTRIGREYARNLFEELEPEAQDLIIWIKQKHVLSPLSKLLSFVYNQYPETTKNSKLV